MTTQTEVVADNAVVRLLVGAGVRVAELMGTHAHVLAMPYERRLARYERATRPVIVLHLSNGQAVPDSTRGHNLTTTVNWDIHIRQSLVDQRAGGYNQRTFLRVIDVAFYLAGWLHRSMQVPEQLGVTDFMGWELDNTEVQESLGAEGVSVHFQSRVSMPVKLALESIVDARRFYLQPDPDTPIIKGPVEYREIEPGLYEFSMRTEEPPPSPDVPLETVIPGAGPLAQDPDVQRVLREGV